MKRWNGYFAAEVGRFQVINTVDRPSVRTSVRLLWDEQNLYVVSVREVGWSDEAHAVSFVYWAKERSYRFATPAKRDFSDRL